jgi:ribose/xylose/arabinose/galactoside ABC-type transport system permease subunit
MSSTPTPSDQLADRRPQKKRSVVDFALDYGIYIALVLLVIFFAIASPFFLTPNNLLNIGQAVARIGILAAGVTIALIARQLDLSVGAVVGLTSVVAALLLNLGLPIGIVMVIALATATIVGVLNGLLVVNFGINSIIATLASTTVATGIAYLLSAGQVIGVKDSDGLGLVNERPLGIPLPVIGLGILYIAAWVFLTRTRFGWHIYATGGNPSAALRAGIRVRVIDRSVLILSSLLAGVAGLLVVSRTTVGDPAYGANDVFLVLTAVLLGGIGLAGGAGHIQRTLAGVLVIGVLSNGLVLLDVQSYYQRIVQGAVLVLAVLLDAIRQKRKSR